MTYKLCPFCKQPPKERPDTRVPRVCCKNIACPIYDFAIPVNLWEQRAGEEDQSTTAANLTVKAIKTSVVDESEALRSLADQCVENISQNLARIERYHDARQLPFAIGGNLVRVEGEDCALVMSAFIVRPPFSEAFIDKFASGFRQVMSEIEQA